jgi:formate dehydrogenase (NADP+) alpha subunit
MVTLTIDGIQVTVPRGTMIVEAAALAGIKIPTLCHNKRLMPFGACRICVVQQKGRKNLMPSCFTPVRNGMDLLTNTPDILKARRTQLQLILITHPLECPVCDAGGECDLQNLVYEYGVIENPFTGEKADTLTDHVSHFIERNVDRCVLCGMCVRICDEVVGANEISFLNRGWKTKIGTDFDRPLNCEFCGQCMSVCPVGALNDRIFLHKARIWDLKETNTTCAYCGVGCTLTVGTRNGRILRVRADENLGSNQGNLCVKGRFGWEYVHNPKRLASPLVKKNGSLAAVSWEEALEFTAKRLQEIKAEKGGAAIGGLCSPRLTNEELYLFQKFMRGALGTNNVDHAGGYVYAAHLALREALGYAASTNSYPEIRRADAILALRSDLSETHPVIKSEIVLATKRRKAKLIVVNSRHVPLSKFSFSNLVVKPSQETALVNGMMRVILDEDLGKKEFIESRTSGFAELKKSLQKYSLDEVAALTGVPGEAIAEAARVFAKAATGVILISTGSCSDAQDGEIARAAANLALLTGQIGRESTGIFVLGEKNNSQGALDLGVNPDLLPGYADLRQEGERSRFAEAWKLEIPAQPGLHGLAMLQAAEEEKIAALYLVGENPLLTYPEAGRTRKALASLKFLVVQDCFLTETAARADVVLPAATFAEKEGTFTNVERRVQRLRPALAPIGQARPDLWIFENLAKSMGVSLNGKRSKDVMEEIRGLVPIYAGIDYARLDSAKNAAGLPWPCLSREDSGTPVLYEKDFPGGKAKFAPAGEPAATPQDSDFPWVLLSGAVKFHSGSLSRWSPGLSRIEAGGYVVIHQGDAAKLGLTEDEEVTLESRYGKIVARAAISPRAAAGVVFVPGNFQGACSQELTGRGLQITGVRISKNGKK